MNHLIIFAHPNTHSFNRAIVESIAESSQKLPGVNVQIRDLYALNFNPVLSWEELNAAGQGIVPADIRYEQSLITQANLITLVYPLWWMGFPAILKGYLDRVLSHGFAYKTENGTSVGLIHHKKMQQFITLGSNVVDYQALGWDKSLDVCLINGLFNYCGITDIDYQLFGDIHLINEKERQQILAQVATKTTENLTALLSP
ncbi:NAD(P)H-dependent oxidoreductase [Conservatibacter flavescens]|uniref:NAD(P)H oxidoreductase n=1 Tax=Conservatibacter flavescens TaxID=28161 RepID=A0A2M8S559_9PAST|nr:NAD(P)H-dependent oxidoreductase [Conservatibacter flavescens]PJG86271.1 NAD(P)H oxidoreductase [Conservatibacter flavescens]